MLFEVILNCFLLWMTYDSLNQVMNVKALRTFHRLIGNAGDVEVNVLVVRRKVELIRIITIFEMTSFFALCAIFPLCRVAPIHRDFGRVFLPSLSGCPDLSEELSSSCNLPTISWVTGCPVRSSMGLGDWVGLEEPD